MSNIYWNYTQSTPLQLRINTAASGDTTLVAAQTGKAVRVYSLRLNVAGAVIVQIKTGSVVREVFNFSGAGGGVVLELRQQPYYSTANGEALVINLSGAVQVDGQVEYFTEA
jgi:hypothetical protein